MPYTGHYHPIGHEHPITIPSPYSHHGVCPMCGKCPTCGNPYGYWQNGWIIYTNANNTAAAPGGTIYV